MNIVHLALLLQLSMIRNRVLDYNCERGVLLDIEVEETMNGLCTNCCHTLLGISIFLCFSTIGAK